MNLNLAIKNLFITLSYFFFGFVLQAQSPSNDSIIFYNTLNTAIDKGLTYIEQNQQKATIKDSVFAGEWPSTMRLKRSYILLGKKRKVFDSNCFSVASIHNALAQIYVLDSSYKKILPMLDHSFDRILTYRTKNTFNFWNLLPPRIILKKGVRPEDQPLVRRPTNFILKSKFINNVTNIADDADDTSLGLVAIALNRKISPKHSSTIFTDTIEIAPIFEHYRDLHRKNRNWYNYLYGNDRETGAYLTWFGEEYSFKRWNIFKTVVHNLTFFRPFSACYPKPYQPYIPFGSNDIDAVVNANILSALAVHKQLHANGVKDAIAYIEKKSRLKNYDHVGIYYPNRYQFPYVVSEAYVNGVDSLKKSLDYIIEYVLETQQKDGSWYSKRKVNHKDPIQSTAFALNTLINYGNIDQNKTKVAIKKAIQYLLEHAIQDENGLHWTGGVFFSGGSLVRNVLYWQSDAYTTAIILKALVNYQKIVKI
jgi:hypothetical protein